MPTTKKSLKKGMKVMIPYWIDRESGEPVARQFEDRGRYSYRVVELWRDLTDEDRRAWEESDASKGMNDAGETRLQYPSKMLPRDASEAPRLWEVVRARVSARKGWRTESGCAQVRAEDGTLWFVKRDHCYPV